MPARFRRKKRVFRKKHKVLRFAKKRASKGSSLTIRTLTGLPDKIQVKLPYTFCYNGVYDPQGVGPHPGDVLACFSGNSYPNLGGYDLDTNPLVYNKVEIPTNFFMYAGQYTKAICSGSSIDIKCSFGGTFVTDNVAVGTPPIDIVLFEPPTVVMNVIPYDGDESDVGPTNENAGTFSWNGVASMAQRPGALTTTGNWTTAVANNLEENMSQPNTMVRTLTTPFGGKCVARFKTYQSVKKYTGVKDVMDNEDLAFTPPETAAASLALTGSDLTPKRGFGYLVKAYVRNGSTDPDATVWQMSGKITYYYTFTGRRPVFEADWNF